MLSLFSSIVQVPKKEKKSKEGGGKKRKRDAAASSEDDGSLVQKAKEPAAKVTLAKHP